MGFEPQRRGASSFKAGRLNHPGTEAPIAEEWYASNDIIAKRNTKYVTVYVYMFKQSKQENYTIIKLS